jgi:hypothetical protein
MSSSVHQLHLKLRRNIASALLTLLGFSLAVALVLLASAMISYNAISEWGRA